MKKVERLPVKYRQVSENVRIGNYIPPLKQGRCDIWKCPEYDFCDCRTDDKPSPGCPQYPDPGPGKMESNGRAVGGREMTTCSGCGNKSSDTPLAQFTYDTWICIDCAKATVDLLQKIIDNHIPDAGKKVGHE